MERQKILTNLRSYDPNFDEARINKAIDFALYYHKDQFRESGAPYSSHPLEVAEIIIEMRLDSDSVITALLHDIVEDTELTLEDIKKNFGPAVAKLVDGVTKLSQIKLTSIHAKQGENFRKLLIAMSHDIRVLLVKLADRLHNMRTINHIASPIKRTRIALETMEIYAPLAERIGIQKIKVELQELCFGILYPEIKDTITNALNNFTINEKQFIDQVVTEIARNLTEENIKAEVYGRRKTPYSIWMKMQQKNLSLDQLADIIAFRIVVDSVGECYQVLGTIHTKYQMVPENFQDFISTPKSNSYQSLHTVVIGPMQQKIEIQIRTCDMHAVAELGVAAHWKYKQDYSNKLDNKQYAWINELLAILKHNPDPEEFLQNTKLAMYYDQVFCFTPQGKLIALPTGATAVDFAYAVHSDIGHHCIGVKINGKNSSLKSILKNGDQVKIVTSKIQTPSPTWERFVVTGKARSEIRRFTHAHQKSEYIRLGKSMLEKAFKAADIPDIPKALKNASKIFKKSKIEDFYQDIAKGLLSRKEVIQKLLPKQSKLNTTLSLLKFKKAPLQDLSVSINGLMNGVAVHLAGCCHPVPSDKIIGVIHTGRGVTVHINTCAMLNNFKSMPEVMIDLTWNNDMFSKQSFICRFKIVVTNEVGALDLITSELTKENINISNFKITQRDVDFYEFYVDIEVTSLEKVNIIIDSFSTKKSIYSIERV